MGTSKEHDMAWTSADTIAEQASRNYRDTRTPQQRTWDARAEAIAEIAARMRGLTYPSSAIWSRDPAIVDLMSDLSRDLAREMHALNVEGYRP
jgi:hypothetical protein